MDIECEGWAKILKVFPDMDFSAELEANPDLTKYLRDSINTLAQEAEDPMQDKECPKLDNDFSRHILMNGLPKCDEKKAAKLIGLLIKLFSKRNMIIAEDDIEMSWDENKVTTGQAFIVMKNEEQAKIAAALFNGHKLDSKHTFSACTFPDFDKIMAIEDKSAEASSSATDYLELNAQLLETKKTEYAYQVGKNITLNALHGQSKVLVNLSEEETKSKYADFHTDKPMQWSPKGTYLISIRSDKVEFIGGSKMTPILTINEPKVESVLFSPCERYLMVYQPKNELAYTIWNFQTHEKLRDFDQQKGEDGNTFKWSHDGSYIAKVAKKLIQKEKVEGEEAPEEEEEEYKTLISIFELPSMKLLKDLDGNRTSIPVDGLQEFQFMPNKPILVYSSAPKDTNMLPRITFIELPSRRSLHMHTLKDSQEMRLYIHPQGTYVAVMNAFLVKKTVKYSVELFDTTSVSGSIPHQQILINREVVEFHNVCFEPQHGKIAIIVTAKKVLEYGQKQFSNDPNHSIAELYQIKSDALLGMTVKKVGSPMSEKIVQIYFSSVGNVFCSVEKDGLTKHSLNFYLINKISNEGQTTSAPTQLNKKGAKLITEKHLAAVEDTYEFRKTARYEIAEKKWQAAWDQDGRYFVMQGKKSSQFDKQTKSIKFFNMFGEMLQVYNDLASLESVQFRPRPRDILKKDQEKKLKKEYKKKYESLFKNEEHSEKKQQSDVVKEARKEVRDDFLNNFFIPQRKAYESQLDKFKALFPIKESDMADKPAEYNNIYAFKETVSQRKIEEFN